MPVYKLKLVRSGWHAFPRMPMGQPQLAAFFLHKMIGGAAVEHAAVLYLDPVHQVTGSSVISTGDLGRAPMVAREIFKGAILANAANVIVSHNHPSGTSAPSPQDIRVTRRLIRAGEIIGIPLLDHIIVNPSGQFTSMRERVELLLWWPDGRLPKEPQVPGEPQSTEGNS